jgi:membrane-bound serine protease (ClpP class)
MWVNPNIAYVLIVLGAMLGLLALASPGTGLLEAGALFTLILAGIEIYLLQLPINLLAVGVLVLGVIPFLLAVRRRGNIIFLALAIAAFVFGSAYLFLGTEWWMPVVDPILALVVSVISGVFLWIAVRKSIEAVQLPPLQDLDTLIGLVGEARTAIHTDGSVQVGGELWSARSKEPIPAGASVRVLSRDGFNLDVEELK